MAYADISFYKVHYYGDEIPIEHIPKWLNRASDALDTMTFGRLKTAYPVEHSEKVKKAVCALAEALYNIDLQQQAGMAQKAEDGTFRGAVESLVAGSQKISFASPAASGSAYAAAAASEPARVALMRDTVCLYLANIPDANGTNLLYAGRERHEPAICRGGSLC